MPLSVVLATAGYDHKIRFWDANTGVCTRAVKFEESQVNSMQISSNKAYLAAAGNPIIHIYDVNSPSDAPVARFEGHTSNVTAVGFQKDARWIYSCAEDGTVKVWDLRAPEAQRTYDCRTAVHSVILHPNQRTLYSADQSGVMRTWDVVADKSRTELAVCPDVPLRSVSMSFDASLLVGGSHKGKLFVMRESASSKEFEVTTSFQAHNEYLLKCVVAPDMSTVATTSSDSSIRLWDPSSWNAARPPLRQHQRWVWDAAFSADSSFMVSASSDQCAKLWDLRSGEVIRNYVGHSLAVTCVALNDSSE